MTFLTPKKDFLYVPELVDSKGNTVWVEVPICDSAVDAFAEISFWKAREAELAQAKNEGTPQGQRR